MDGLWKRRPDMKNRAAVGLINKDQVNADWRWSSPPWDTPLRTTQLRAGRF